MRNSVDSALTNLFRRSSLSFMADELAFHPEALATHERQNARRSTKWLTWSFRRCSSSGFVKSVKLLSGR
jgi:hypothetical protein